MKVKKMLYGLAVVTLLIVVGLYAGFFLVNEPEKTKENTKEVIRVLAPYQAKLHQQILDTIAAEYSRDEKHPRIEMIYVPKENLEKELSLRRMTGENQVDVIICDNTLTQELIGQEMLREVPVSRQLREEIDDDRLWYSLQHDARYFGYPLTCDPYVLYYNADVLEEKGVEVPTSWKELIRAGYQVKKSRIQSIGIAAKRDDELTNLFWLMMYSSGGNFNTNNQEKWTECFQNFQQLSLAGLTSQYAANFTQEDLAQEFANGRVYLMINQMSISSILKSNQTNFQVGMAEVPSDEAGGTFWFGNNVCITKEAGQGALAFIQHLTSREVSERINDAMGTLQVYRDLPYKEKGKIYMEDTQKLNTNARPMNYYKMWSEICSIVSDGVDTVLNTRLADPGKVADETRDQVRVAIMSDS